MLKLVKVFFAKKGKNDIKYTMPMGFQRHEGSIKELPFFLTKDFTEKMGVVSYFFFTFAW